MLSAPKRYWHGTHRYCSPEETLERIKPHFKRMGLTRLADITGLDRIGVPTVLSVRPDSAYLSVDAGKGFTLAAAMVSASMECVERYLAENARLYEILLSYQQLAESYPVIPLDNLALTKNSLFHPSREERWTMAWDIMNQVETAVPSAAVPLGWVGANGRDLVSFQHGSNGLASGNHFLEALAAGLYEVIERDAIACAHFAELNSGRTPARVRLETVEYPLVRELIGRLHAADTSLVLFDRIADTEVPTYVAFIYDRSTRRVGMFKGYGSHLDHEIAMVRAITEAIQSRLIYVAGSRDDAFRYKYVRLKSGDDTSSVRQLESVPQTLDAGSYISESTDTFEGDINTCLEKLERVGVTQVLVYDLSEPEFGVYVVRVIVPGLEGYMFDHYAPGKRAICLASRFSGPRIETQ